MGWEDLLPVAVCLESLSHHSRDISFGEILGDAFGEVLGGDFGEALGCPAALPEPALVAGEAASVSALAISKKKPRAEMAEVPGDIGGVFMRVASWLMSASCETRAVMCK